jgi:UDP:flavonoid glycosyltransferase YjiC (YdhE family)
MARVLCAWEFGGDLGHVRRVIPIAHELRAMGHEVTLVFRDSSFLENGRAQGFETFIAPLLNTQREMSPSPLNFSDILLNIGYGDVRGLAGALRAWQSMLEMLSPDVVVADYAPTALIAATLASIRTVTVGTGFSVPAAGDPIPDLRPWSPTDPNILRALDDRILGTVRRAVGPNASRLPARAYELFKGRLDLMCTFREIDPFGPRDGVEYVGPQGDATSGIEVRWTGEKAQRVFAYLKPRSPRFEATLAGLASLDAETIVAVPGLEAARAKSASTGSMRVIASAVNLGLVLPEASMCVSHAGPGVAARAMAAGVPMVLLPLQLEQFLISKRIEKTGAALVSNPEDPPPDYPEWFSEFLSRNAAREAAKRLRDRYHDHDFAQATVRAARRISDVAAA